MSNLETVLADAGYEQINADLIEQLKKKQEAGTLTAAEANLLAEIEALGLDLSTLDGQALTAEDLQALGDAQVSLPSPASAPFASGGLGGLAGLGALGGGGGGASGGTAVAVVANSFNGQLINGYIQGAEVFQDINNDGIWNAGEPKGTTDSLGRFTLSGYVNGGGMLIASTTENTIDTSTGLRVTTEFKAPADSAVISPLSTLLTEEGMTQDLLKSAFDIDDSIDILTFDPISSAENAATAELASMALKFKSVSNQVSNLIDVGVSTIDSSSNEDAAGVSAAVVEKLVAKIKAVPTDLDLTDDDIIADVLTEASAELSTADLASAIASAATQLGALNLKIDEIVPEDLVLFSSVSSEQDFDGHFTDVQTFGNGATFNFTTAVDPNGVYDRVAHVASGTGYAPNVNVAFAAFQSIGTGFATGFEGFNAKVSNTPNGRLEVKLIGAGAGMDSVADITLATYSGATDLGNGWFDVTIPFTDFSNPGNIPAHSGYLIGMPGDNGADAFDFYFTDVGFDDFTDVSASLESINKATKVAQSDLETMIQTAIEQGDFSALANFDLDAAVSGAELYTPEGVDLTLFSSSDASGDYSPATLYGGVTPFESGATFDFQTAVDPNGVYDRVGRVTSGTGYGPQIALVAFSDVNGAGDSAGFADGYDAFQAKVASTPNGQLTVKFFGGADNSPESVVTINLNDTDVSTDLGNGWYDVEIPFTDFSNPNEISGHQGFLIEANTTDVDPFDFYFTDLGLNGVARDASDVDLTGYSLAFEDNFDEIGSGPDSNDWTFDLGNDGWGNNEVQNYQGDLDDAVIVDVGAGDTVNGALQITAQRSGGEITSARVRSDIDLPAYGYYEVRAKLPAEAGAWPAIWLLGDGGRATWPNEGEIDLVEWSSLYASSDSEIISAMHFPDNHGGNALDTNETLNTPVTQWHTYQAWWTPTEIAIGVDGTRADAHLVYEKPAGADNDAWPFDGGMDLIMNIAIGGTLGGTGNVPAGDFSYNMLIDYVRVYQNPDHVSTGSGTGATAPSSAADAPTEQAADVISLFSDSYTDITVNNFGPVWGDWQTSRVTNADGMLQVSNLNVQGIQIADPSDNSGSVDASAKESLNVDVWLPEAGSFKWFLISPGPAEASVTLTGDAGWNSFNIDLDAFSGVDLANIIQFKLDAQNLDDAATDFYLDNIYFNDSASDTGIPTAPSSAADAPTEQAADVISLFSDSYTDITVNNFGPVWGDWQTSRVTNADGMLQVSNLNVQGIQIADPSDNSGSVNASAKESLNVDVWLPEAGSFKWFLISPGPAEASVTLTGDAGWNSFNIDLDAFSGVDLANIIQFKLDAQNLDDAATDFYLDNIYFNDSSSDTGSASTEPTAAPDAPTANSANVTSLFSDSYTDIASTTWSTSWDQTGDPEDVDLSGNTVKKYTNVGFIGIEPGSTIDASGMDTLNLTVWRTDATADLKIKLVDYGSDDAWGNDNVEHEINLAAGTADAVAAGEWVSLEIDMSDFTGLTTSGNIGQIILSSHKYDANGGAIASGETLYIDNFFFSSTPAPAEPTAAPDAPTANSANVTSLFSDSYTDIASTTWSTSWDQTGDPEDVDLNGNTVKKYTNVGFIGIEPGSTIDASGMDTLNLTVWRTDATADLKIKLVDYGSDDAWGNDNVEHEINLAAGTADAVAAGEWVSLEIDMSDFTGLTTSGNIGQIILSSHKYDANGGAIASGETLYIDNFFFSSTPAPAEPTAAPDAPTANSTNVTSLFSDSYTDIASTTWSTSWDQTGDPEDVDLSGNTVKKYTNVGFIGIEPGSTIDASGMDTLNLTVWRTDATADLKIKLVDYGSDDAWGNDNVEHEINLAAGTADAVAAGEWVSLEIDMSDFTGLTTSGNIGQIILSSHKYDANGGAIASGETLYIDNFFFSSTPPALEISFEPDDDSGYSLVSFGGNASEVVTSANAPTGSDGQVAKVTKVAGQVWAGTTFIDLAGNGSELISDGSETVSIRILSAKDGATVRLKLEDSSNGNANVELDATTASDGVNEWETLTWDFSSADHNVTFDKASIFFDFGNAGAGEEYYFDDVTFNGFIS